MPIAAPPQSIPADSLFHASLPVFDYVDVFGSEFGSQANLQVGDALRAFFLCAPPWVRFLMRLRDRIVSRIGLKTSEAMDEAALARLEIAPGKGAGVFRIWAVAENEIITGEDDRHLDFRVLARLEKIRPGNRYRLTVATGVHLKNLLGRAYFLPVKFFHRRIAATLVKAMARRLSETPATPAR